jgi:hypothetical protein
MSRPCLVRMLAVGAIAFSTSQATAQSWTAPLLSSPVAEHTREIYVADISGAGAGAVMRWSPLQSVPGLRLRLGMADGRGSGWTDGPAGPGATLAYIAGLDLSGRISRDPAEALQVGWVAGFGAGIGEHTLLSAPVGISVGYNGGRLRPYMVPQLQLRQYRGTSMHNFGLEFSRVVDWGVDVTLPADRLLRLSVTTGEQQGFALGLSF